MAAGKILLHSCCGPCTCHPYKTLLSAGNDVVCHWFNPNIHPFNEYRMRLMTFGSLEKEYGFQPLYDPDTYKPEPWLDYTRPGWSSGDRKLRCSLCYAFRLERTAAMAEKKNFESFSTTLLYSRHQFHDEIRIAGEEAAKKYGVRFIYEDFRTGWNEGIRLSKEAGLYRQSYCGCVFSLNEAQGLGSNASQKQGK